eukprot:CAMPEP_0177696142 /NCGR_PEP_ID=MMETSP0484_2-20121128/3824_1 /TAXON_ID=354590 /ORGANISM="Rhodomonas lens, Strain RHODO" /LENGTH=103 /DNA_ID=CAMNT_0019207097 /DNA_START=330 /DNA_END=638 /DNA_ORIENTATION=+
MLIRCLLLLSLGISTALELQSRVMPNEHIVTFKEYLSESAQTNVLNEMLGQGAWAAIPNARPFTRGADSDFTVIKVKESGAEEALRAHALVKGVHAERKLKAL